VAPWEEFKIGGGAPPFLTLHGWLIIYHGVGQTTEPTDQGRNLCYSAGVMVLSKERPRTIR
jgi:beta-1,2-mannobiose phosphorylase / 1,2-beta-oligomannan phosphorylase